MRGLLVVACLGGEAYDGARGGGDGDDCPAAAVEVEFASGVEAAAQAGALLVGVTVAVDEEELVLWQAAGWCFGRWYG